MENKERSLGADFGIDVAVDGVAGLEEGDILGGMDGALGSPTSAEWQRGGRKVNQ